MTMLTKHQKRWRRRRKRWMVRYRRDRRNLIKEMGGRCHRCGYRWRLEFHHLRRRTWRANKVGRWTRLRRYREEWEAGLVVLACSTCNKKIGRPLDTEWEDEVEGGDGVPF